MIVADLETWRRISSIRSDRLQRANLRVKSAQTKGRLHPECEFVSQRFLVVCGTTLRSSENVAAECGGDVGTFRHTSKMTGQ